MDWENGRRQLEQYQHNIERSSCQLEDASNALRQAQDNVPDIGNDIGKAFFVRPINLPSEPALIHITVLGTGLG